MGKRFVVFSRKYSFRNISNSRDETQSLFSYYYEQVFPYIIPFVFPVSIRKDPLY